jgi:hypothetical protein
MSDGAHLLIPFAASAEDGCIQARRALQLPNLERLLARMERTQVDEGRQESLSMPHERMLAREFGLQASDGLIPWAAWQVKQAARDPQGAAWAWITPCHWRVGRDRIGMDHPRQLDLTSQESQALVEAMRPYFSQDGIELEYDAPTLWLARGDVFRDLPCASTDRVIGHDVDPWLPRDASARPIRRLQQEMQMLLYTHPVNEERTRGGQQPVNSFWVSGTGALPASGARPAAPQLRITHYLRDTALLGDWQAWASAWQQLDSRECAALLRELEAGTPVHLTLCGDRNAQTWSGRGGGLLRRLSSMFGGPRVAAGRAAQRR